MCARFVAPIDVWLIHHQERSMMCRKGIHTDGANQKQWMTQTFAASFAYKLNRMQ
jgi:hypothetical protein